MTYKHKTTGTQAKLAEDGKYYIHNCSIGIPKQFIEDSRMWEKKDGFEILVFKSDRLSFYMPAIQKDGTYLDYPVMHCDGGGATLEWMLKEPEYYIYSVKRLSDNVVFSVGDKTDEGIITRLRFIGDVYQYSCVEQHGWQSLEKAVKVKEPILVTEDGVELFDVGEFVWDTSDTNWDYLGSTPAGVMKAIIPKSKRKAWAKKENAEKYMKENRPRYSLNDIKEAVKKLNCFGTTLIEYLENNNYDTTYLHYTSDSRNYFVEKI